MAFPSVGRMRLYVLDPDVITTNHYTALRQDISIAVELALPGWCPR